MFVHLNVSVSKAILIVFYVLWKILEMATSASFA